MEYIFAREALTLKAEGWKVYGMGLSPLSSETAEESWEIDAAMPVPTPGAQPALDAAETVPGTLDVAVNMLYHHFNHFYHFTGLHAFKDKFDPTWEPRYLAFPSAGALPRVVLSVVRANSSQSLFQFLWKKREKKPLCARLPDSSEEPPRAATEP
jgi:lysylphosphatidylglycerol synthetase-like protein (DUF2156 family)